MKQLKYIDKFRFYFKGRIIYWSKYFRIYCDGGYPIVKYIPNFKKLSYHKHWNMFGFLIIWLGREFYFSFGEDINNLYDI